MRILKSETFVVTPWKNGGGVTREVLKQDGANGFDWRLSIADVDQSGPFSHFDGYHRILTVLSGKGMVLRSAVLDRVATPLAPVHFDGAEDIEGVLLDGPCRDFNVIYQPNLYAADVSVQSGEIESGEFAAVLLLEGRATLDVGDIAILEHESLHLPANAKALVVRLRKL